MRDNTFFILITIHIVMAVAVILFRGWSLIVFATLCWAAELILMLKYARYF